MNAPADVLVVRDLSVRVRTPAGPRALVESVDLTLRAGRTTALVGASGSGKSLTALAIAGALDPLRHRTSGSIILDGVDLLADAGARRRSRGRAIGFAFQEPAAALNPSFTIGAQLIDLARLDPALDARAARDRAIASLDAAGLRPGSDFLARFPHRLSGGQLRRVMLAHALIHRPRVLIADEPTTGLDLPLVVEWLDLLRSFAAEIGQATLLITHDWRVARAIAADVAVIERGRIVESGEMEAVVRAPREAATRRLLSAAFGTAGGAPAGEA